MYTILVVDDEKIIADGVRDMLEAELSYDVKAHKAYSGKQALEIFKTNRIDVLLTDVSMPEMDGFELQKSISEMYPDCTVVFISASDDFHHMQSALRSNSVDYVLKTEGDETVVAAVEKAIALFETRRKNALLLATAHENLEKALPLLREHYIQKILESDEYSLEHLENQFSSLKMPLRHTIPVLILIGWIDWYGESLEALGRAKRIYGIRNIIDMEFADAGINVSVEHENDKLVWLIQPVLSENDEIKASYEHLINHIGQSLNLLQEIFRELFESEIFFVFSAKPVGWHEVSENFYILKSGFHNVNSFRKNSIFIKAVNEIRGTELEKFRLHQEYIIRTQIKKAGQLELLLGRGQKDEFMQSFEEAISQISNCKKISYELLCEAYYSFAIMFLGYINRRRLQGEVNRKMNIDLLMRLEEHSSWSSAVSYLNKLAEAIFEIDTSSHDTEANKIIYQMEGYIMAHLHEDVSLNKIAEILHFNPSYLSRIFKQLTGKSLTEYIAEVRIQKSCELLADSRLKIYEIASRTGFESASYFNRFFKKYLNLTPQEYRDKMQE